MSALTTIEKQATDLCKAVADMEADINTHAEKVSELEATKIALKADTSRNPLELSTAITDCNRDLEINKEAIEIFRSRLGPLVAQAPGLSQAIEAEQKKNDADIEATNTDAIAAHMKSDEVTHAMAVLLTAYSVNGHRFKTLDEWAVAHGWNNTSTYGISRPQLISLPDHYENPVNEQLRALQGPKYKAMIPTTDTPKYRNSDPLAAYNETY